MPYQKSDRLPGERASKIGHLEVVKHPLVQELCQNFEDATHPGNENLDQQQWIPFPTSGNEMKLIFSSDGSFQIIEQHKPITKSLGFTKTALFRLDTYAISKVDSNHPHPFALRDIMQDSALFHATVFPLRNINFNNQNTYNAIREIIFHSIKDKGFNDSLQEAMMETLKWFAYKKWNQDNSIQLDKFGCPHCYKDTGRNDATLEFNKEKGECPNCSQEIFITDLFGFHFNMQEDFAPNQVASDYMSIAETLMILTPIRYYWENDKEILKRCLFVKDGPLSLRATLSKFAEPIRDFFSYAKQQGYEIAMIGQEKSGQFFDHLEIIGKSAPKRHIFIPDNKYIRKEIQHSNLTSLYGLDTNYGAKVFVKYDDYHKMVFNIPTGKRGEYVDAPSPQNLLALNNILATLPKILSNKYEGALLPIELANSIASLATYPSAKILKLFSERPQ